MHPEIVNNAIRPEINIGTLLTDFFTGYAQEFDWATFGISLRNGGRHFRKNDRGWSYAHNSIENIALEDPQDSCKSLHCKEQLAIHSYM
jgi:DNA polymerase sigma